jgi:hypothetical protein
MSERDPPAAGAGGPAGIRPGELTDHIRFLERRLRTASFEQFNADEQQALEELLVTLRGLARATPE